MNKLLLALGALMAGALLIPDVAEAQRGGRGGGGGFRGGGGGGFGGGGGGFRGGGGFGGPRMYVPGRGARVGTGNRGFRGGAIAARPGVPGGAVGVGPGGFRQAAITNRGGRFDGRYDNRYGNRGDWRYGYGATGGRYPYYGGRYPYYGGRYYGRYPYNNGWGWGAAGLATGAAIGAAATYPYYGYPYSTYQTPVASAAGGYCVTSVRTCALTTSAPVGTGCSCSTPGGRARGTVQ
jgi:hypothetical protein